MICFITNFKFFAARNLEILTNSCLPQKQILPTSHQGILYCGLSLLMHEGISVPKYDHVSIVRRRGDRNIEIMNKSKGAVGCKHHVNNFVQN